jgi:uncharacterized protein GlcG (DUF336 family)
MNQHLSITTSTLALGLLTLISQSVMADNPCKDLPDHATLTQALKKAVAVGDPKANGGFALNMWATVVARDGAVCAVTFTGDDWGEQWLGSRVISAQKANTVNAFSLPTLALSSANLFSAVQGGGSLFGLQFSNPVDTGVAYAGEAGQFGKADDPLVGKRVGGINVFGGGLALYNAQGKLVGGLGVSGDTSCADHNIAWKTRHALNLDRVPAGVNKKSGNAKGDDNIIYDIVDGKSASGFGHPDCGLGEKTVAEALVANTHPVGNKP